VGCKLVLVLALVLVLLLVLVLVLLLVLASLQELYILLLGRPEFGTSTEWV
jgi:hypothetical protein